jgi:hypothetical protein
VHDRLVPHVDLRQHRPPLLLLLLLPAHRRFAPVQDTLGLHSVFVHLTVRTDSADQQGERLLLLFQLHL